MNATETLNFKDQLLAHFKQQLSTLYGQAELRHDAAKIFEEQGFPTRHWEDYKYINPEAVLKKGFSFHTEMMRGVTANDVKEFTLVKNAVVLVVVNGIYRAELSVTKNLPAGIIVSSIAEAVHSNETAKKHFGQYAKSSTDPFIALNTAL